MKKLRKHQTFDAIELKKLDEDAHRIKNRYKLFLSTASKVLTQWLTWC